MVAGTLAALTARGWPGPGSGCRVRVARVATSGNGSFPLSFFLQPSFSPKEGMGKEVRRGSDDLRRPRCRGHARRLRIAWRCRTLGMGYDPRWLSRSSSVWALPAGVENCGKAIGIHATQRCNTPSCKIKGGWGVHQWRVCRRQGVDGY